MSGSRMHDVFLDTKGLTLEQIESFGEGLAISQRGNNWWIGDAARYAKYVLKLGDNYSQIFPPWTSPGLIQRCEAVAGAYTRQDRKPGATWTQHMQVSRDPDRLELLEWMVNEGLTSVEARECLAEKRRKAKPEPEAPPEKPETASEKRWLIAFDTYYFAHRHYYSGAGVETAMQVAEWVQRTVERLKEKGCTDCLCAFEGSGSFRKELTKESGWEQQYKDRPPKPDDLRYQLGLVRELLEGFGFLCVSVDGYEADDVLASAAKQFPGKTTIVSADKDLKQSLSSRCNILTDVSWIEDELTGLMAPEYQWYTAKMLKEDTGLTPDQHIEFQTLMGDNCDSISGAIGVGEKGAADLINEFGTVEAAIAAAKEDNERIKPAKRKALIEFEGKLEITRQLVTLVDTLELPENTRI